MTRSRCRKLLLAFLWIAVSGVCSQEINAARAESANVSIHDVPIAQLMSEITKATPGPLHDYFAGVLAAREGKDEEAIQLLTQAWPPLRRTDPDQAAFALRLLADVYDREGLYARSSPLYDELETSGLLNRLPETYRQGAKDDAELARVLAGSPVQTITRNGPVHLVTSRNNPLGLITTELTVNGVRSEWILDTGANESVISRSLASQLHLPTLPGVAHTSGGVTGIENELHVALLPNLPLGGVTTHNVVLMVLDDANLTIPNGNGGSYRIAGIIGFPVLRALGRITFHHDGTLDATVDGGSASAGSALELHMLNPVIEATVEGEPLPFTLDTGASGTNLSVRFFDHFQLQEPTWKKVQTKNFGAGGEMTSQSYLVPSIALEIGGRTVALHNLAVASASQHADIDTLFGNVGEDLFQSVQSFTFDFPNMRFVMGPPLSAPEATRKIFGQSLGQPIPDGRRLALGQYCYTMSTTKDGTTIPVGVTLQSITREQENGVDALAVVVHQHMFDGKFDLRDSFLLRRDDLRPIRLDTDRDGKPHVHLEYCEQNISGWKMQGGSKQPIEVELSAPVWDGNLWGLTFAALPLTAAATLSLPTYQYDSGLGSFYVNVVDQHQENTPAGIVQAWRIHAGIKRSEMVEYTVSTQAGLEIAYHAGPYTQRLGGDCSQIK